MRICLLIPNVPRLGRGGGADRVSGLLSGLLRRKHDVHLLSVVGKHADRDVTDEQRRALADVGVTLHLVEYVRAPVVPRGLRGLANLLLAPETVLTPHERATRPAVTARLREIAPDCVMTFSPDPLVYVQDIDDLPVFALLSETMHLNMRTRSRYACAPRPLPDVRAKLRALRDWLAMAARERLDLRHCRRPTRLAFSAPHYVAWAQAHGLRNVSLFRTSTQDAGGPRWRERRAAVARGERTRILVIGHLHSTNNVSGVPVLFEEVLPALLRLLPRERFELHVVGEYRRLPEHLQHWVNSPDVIFRGPVTPADDEFLAADVVLVTVPAETGPRTRILSAFTFGCCVVAHANNALGIPELRHEENCLLAADGEGLAAMIARAAGDAALRARLGENGRRLFDTQYTHEVAVEALERLLEETVSEWSCAPSPNRAAMAAETRAVDS